MPRSNLPITASTAPDFYMDTWRVAVGSTNVEREIVVIGGTASDDMVGVASAIPATNALGLPVRLVPQTTSGEILAKISDTVTVAAHAVTNAGTFVMQENGAALTALQIIDDWDESDRAKVNPIVGQAGITAASGNVAANTPRVTLAGDDRAVTALEIIDNIVSGSEAQVDVVAALPAGDNNIGNVDIVTVPADPFGTIADAVVAAGATGSISAKLRAISRDVAANIVLAAGNNNIGDVDVASIAAGDNNIGNMDIVTLPNDPLGLIADAVVAAGATGTVSAKLRAISRDLVANVVLAAGTNNIGDVDIASALPAGTNNIGDVDVLTIAAGDNNIGNVDIVTVPADPFGTIADSVVAAGATGTLSAKLRAISRDVVANIVLAAGNNNIGDVDVASIAAGDNNIGNVDVVTLPALVAGSAAIGKLAANDGVDIGDVTINNSTLPIDGRVTAEVEGSLLRYQGSTATVQYAPFTATASGNVSLIASATGRIVVLGYTLVTNSAFALQFKDSTDSTLSGVMPFSANGGNVNAASPYGVFKTTTGTALVLAGATATGITGGHITYLRVPA